MIVAHCASDSRGRNDPYALTVCCRFVRNHFIQLGIFSITLNFADLWWVDAIFELFGIEEASLGALGQAQFGSVIEQCDSLRYQFMVLVTCLKVGKHYNVIIGAYPSLAPILIWP